MNEVGCELQAGGRGGGKWLITRRSDEGGSSLHVNGILRLVEAVLADRLLKFQVVPHIVD